MFSPCCSQPINRSRIIPYPNKSSSQDYLVYYHVSYYVGSGKTTNVRACLKYLTKLKEETGGPKAFTLEEMVSTTQKLIQALGSAKNSANTYSSRYFVNYRFTVNTANKKTLGLAI